MDGTLNPAFLRDKYPDSVSKVEKYFLENTEIRESLTSQGMDITEFPVLTEFVNMIIQYHPRKLYDVFDSLGCRIFILDHPDGSLPSEVDPTAFVFYNNIRKESKSAATRVQAEYQAFMDAFELLNN